jgi:hypothetical protein
VGAGPRLLLVAAGDGAGRLLALLLRELVRVVLDAALPVSPPDVLLRGAVSKVLRTPSAAAAAAAAAAVSPFQLAEMLEFF